MKKTIILLAILVMAGNVDAKIRVGLKGGLNFSSLSITNLSFENRTGWHIGGALNIGLPFGITLQPELLYNSKGANGALSVESGSHIIVKDKNTSIGYIEVPVDLQWGLKLPLLRPYISLTPYMSYALNSGISMGDIRKWDGGIGLGAGIDIWKLQVSVRYFWGFGKVSNISGSPSVQNRNVMLSFGVFL